jgi:diguanylate cyclase (GGDEF)-like protein
VDGLHGAQIPRSQPEREQLAKEWLLRLIERTPLAELGELPLTWIVSEAPALIADILGRLGIDDLQAEPGVAEARLAESLSRLRPGPGAAEEIPKDLAMLQSLLVEAINTGVPRRRAGDFPRAAERLAEVFGEIQGAVNRSLVDQGAIAAEHGAAPEESRLQEWMRALLAEQQRYGFGFGLALVDVDGLSRINDAYGRAAGDRLVGAVGDVIRRQIRSTDHAFRFDDDEFAVLAPHSDLPGLLVMAERIADLIESAQAPEGPRIAISIGVAACPADGDTEERLVESATAATYAAKAAGRSVGTNPDAARTALQDR